jgi:hypothetical protein
MIAGSRNSPSEADVSWSIRRGTPIYADVARVPIAQAASPKRGSRKAIQAGLGMARLCSTSTPPTDNSAQPSHCGG